VGMNHPEERPRPVAGKGLRCGVRNNSQKKKDIFPLVKKKKNPEGTAPISQKEKSREK